MEERIGFDKVKHAKNIAFMNLLLKSFPDLRPIYEEHMKDYCGEMLPHYLLADVTRYVVSLCVQMKNRTVRPELREILDFFEYNFSSGDDDIRELISVSFLENFPRPELEEEGLEIRNLVGPTLAKELQVIG